jgi:hypothetical protein
VHLGRRLRGSIAPAVYAIVERGCMKRPQLALALRCQVELRAAGYPEVRIVFAGDTVYVEDAPPGDEHVDPPGEELSGEELARLEEIAGELAPPGDPMLDTYERTARFTPDLVAEAALEDLIAMFASPMLFGVPNLAFPRGWAAISAIAARRVRIRGNVLRARQVVRLLQL